MFEKSDVKRLLETKILEILKQRFSQTEMKMIITRRSTDADTGTRFEGCQALRFAPWSGWIYDGLGTPTDG